MRKRRRRWYQFNPKVEAYHDRFQKKWQNMTDRNLAHHILKLPADFTCYHFSKAMSMWERMHFAIIISLGQLNGQFEYDMLEVERGILRKVR